VSLDLLAVGDAGVEGEGGVIEANCLGRGAFEEGVLGLIGSLVLW